ncbi:hypothetical protein D3C72_1547070 [compost metagenome]
MAGAPTAAMASCISAMLKFDTPICFVSPSALASASAPMNSATGTALPGEGQWISVRSTWSVRSLARLSFRLGTSLSFA